MRSLGWIAGALACVLLLSACGKKAPPSPLGPADQITWPKQYPVK